MGLQKKRFSQSNETSIPKIMERTNKLREDYHNIIGSCPFRCGECETHMHYMTCTSYEANSARTKLVKEFRKSLQKRTVHPVIISVFITGLLWSSKSVVPTMITISDTNLNQVLYQALEEQTRIGWSKLRRGFLSNSWAKAQRIYDGESNLINSHDWNKHFVTCILEFCWKMWEVRNNALHGNDTKSSRKKHLSNAQQQVDNLYERAELFDMNRYKDLHKVFKMKRENRMKKGLVSLLTWIKLAQDILVKVEQREAGAIEKWLVNKETYKGKT